MAESDGIYENYEPTFGRVVKQKRFDPQQKLEDNTRRRLERAAIDEEIRAQSQPVSRQVPTVFGTPRRPRTKIVAPRQLSREDDFTLEGNAMTASAPTKRCYDDMSGTQEYTNDLQQGDRTMMPRPVKPRRRFQKTMDQQEAASQMQKQQWLDTDYEYLVPRNVPQAQPPITFPDADYEYVLHRNVSQREPKRTLIDSPVYETHSQTKKSAIIQKKPVLARWPLAFKDLDEVESPHKRARIEPPPELKQTASPRAPGAPRVVSSRRPYLETIREELKPVRPPKPPRKHPPTSGQSQSPAEPKLDPFCTSLSVFSLNTTNFRDFLGEKTAALVMFYKPFKSSCVKGRKYFVKAAESNQRHESAFAGVDCSVEEDLCLKEGISTVPTYKIYAQGQLVNTVKDFLFFNDRSMKRFVDNVPPFTQDGIAKPPCRSEHSWLKKAMRKLKL